MSQAFHDWRVKTTAGPTPAGRDESELVVEIRATPDEFDGTYGAPA